MLISYKVNCKCVCNLLQCCAHKEGTFDLVPQRANHVYSKASSLPCYSVNCSPLKIVIGGVLFVGMFTVYIHCNTVRLSMQDVRKGEM